jgi:hypothetical protein
MEPLAANVSMTAGTRASMGGTMSATMAMSSPASMASMPTSNGLMNSTGMAAQMAAHFGPVAAPLLLLLWRLRWGGGTHHRLSGTEKRFCV